MRDTMHNLLHNFVQKHILLLRRTFNRRTGKSYTIIEQNNPCDVRSKEHLINAANMIGPRDSG